MTYYPRKANTYHLRDAASDISGYKRLVMLPQTVETEATLTGASNSSAEVLIKAFSSDAVGVVSIPAGVWRFNLKAKVDNATDTTQIKIYVYSRNLAGTETALFNVTSAEINNTTVDAVTILSAAQAAFTVVETDRIIIKFYALSNSGTDKTVTLYYQGVTNYSTVLLPDVIPVHDGDMTKVVYDPDGDGIIEVPNVAIDGAGVANAIAYWTDTNTLSADGSIVMDATNHRIGIVRTTPLTALDMIGSIRLNNSGQTVYAQYDTSTTGTTGIIHDVNIYPADGTSTALMRYFRLTNTSAAVVLQVMKGNNTNTTQHYLRGNGNSYLNFDSGNLGIGTSAADKKLEVNDSGGACLRLTYNDSNGSAANKVDFDVSSTGDLTVTPSGGDVVVAGNTVRMGTSVYRRYYHLPLFSANPGASGPTWTAPSANSTGGWRLDAATEILYLESDIHADWDGATDLKVDVRWMVNVNNAGGGTGDTVDLKLVCYYKGIGDTAAKTQTVEVATVVGQSAQYKQFSTTFTIDWDAALNVVEVGDVIGFALNLETDTSEVDDIVVTNANIEYQTTHIGIESGDV